LYFNYSPTLDIQWSPYYEKDKKILEKIQRRFSRLIPGLSELSYEDRLKSLRLWSVEDRRLRADLIEVYRMYHGLSAVDFETSKYATAFF